MMMTIRFSLLSLKLHYFPLRIAPHMSEGMRRRNVHIVNHGCLLARPFFCKHWYSYSYFSCFCNYRMNKVFLPMKKSWGNSVLKQKKWKRQICRARWLIPTSKYLFSLIFLASTRFSVIAALRLSLWDCFSSLQEFSRWSTSLPVAVCYALSFFFCESIHILILCFSCFSNLTDKTRSFYPWKRAREASCWDRRNGKSKHGTKVMDYAGRGNVLQLSNIFLFSVIYPVPPFPESENQEAWQGVGGNILC